MTNRWAIIQHTLSKESQEGLHFDLLLENGASCRTWRLSSIPILNGPQVEAVLSVPHQLYWLEREESAVSNGRGWAKRIFYGQFHGSLPLNETDFVSIEINSSNISGRLELGNNLCELLDSY